MTGVQTCALPIYYAEKGLAGLSIPGQATDTTLTHIFPHDGWAVTCTKPTNTAYNSGNSCFRDGLGLIFKASPHSGHGSTFNQDHGNFAGLSYQLWAYGAPITDAGGEGISAPAKVTEGQYGILVDGIGQWQKDGVPTQPFYARLTGYKKGTNYEYFAGDATNAYPKIFTDAYGAPLTTDLQKVQRHMLLVRGKYYVVFDDLQSGHNSKFTTLYHIPWLRDAADPRNGKTDTFKFGANQTEYSYTTSNITAGNASETAANERQVTVKVKMINDPSTFEVIDMTGTGNGVTTPQLVSPGLKRGGNVRTNPLPEPAQNYMKNVMAVGDPYPAAHALWISNTQKQRNFHFMSVIYPQKPGATAPTITRIDDFTARVVNDDGSVDVISFNPDTAPADTTILIDLEDLTPLPVVDDIKGTTITSVPYVPPTGSSGQTLTVIKSGTGTGAVTGGSINCGPSCTYTGTGSVTLVATPVAGSVFTGWSGGGCTGTAPCTVQLSSSASVTATFAVAAPGPTITNPAVSSITPSSALITWNTNASSTSQVRFGVTTGYGSISALITTLLPNHAVPLIRLLPNTTYHYQIISKDAQGNTTESPDMTFTTAANGITVLPPSNTSATSVPVMIGASTTAVVVRPPVIVPTPVVETPIVNTKTPAVLTVIPPLTKSLEKGDKGEQVISLQTLLKAQGYIPTLSGIFDSTTISALKVFQWKYNLAAPGDKGYGTTDERTRTKINALLKALPSSVTNTKTPAVVDAPKTAPTTVTTPSKVTNPTPVTPAPVSTSAKVTFTANLSLGMTSPQVKALQEFLNAKGYTVATSGTGSPGKESTYFGPATQSALIKFQKAQKITPAEGFFGPLTRAKVEAMK